MAIPPTTNRIKELREAAGMSQEDVAHKLGTTQQQVGRHERGIRRLTIQWINRYAAVFQVAPSAIIAEGVPESIESDVELVLEMGGLPGVSEAIAARGLRVYRVTKSLIPATGIQAGAILTVDESEAAIKAVASGDVVIARYRENNTLILRQYVHPGLIVTNAPRRNIAVRLDDRSVPQIVTILQQLYRHRTVRLDVLDKSPQHHGCPV